MQRSMWSTQQWLGRHCKNTIVYCERVIFDAQRSWSSRRRSKSGISKLVLGGLLRSKQRHWESEMIGNRSFEWVECVRQLESNSDGVTSVGLYDAEKHMLIFLKSNLLSTLWAVAWSSKRKRAKFSALWQEQLSCSLEGMQWSWKVVGNSALTIIVGYFHRLTPWVVEAQKAFSSSTMRMRRLLFQLKEAIVELHFAQWKWCGRIPSTCSKHELLPYSLNRISSVSSRTISTWFQNRMGE